RPAERPLLLGAVKSNIGHLEAAAGVAGLIKTALALHFETIPGNLHFQAANENIDFDGLKLVAVADRRPWQRGDHPRIAGVSSFGFGGTNAHVVLQEAPAPVTARKTAISE